MMKNSFLLSIAIIGLFLGFSGNVFAADQSVEYRTHVQNDGWQSFVSNGKMSGTEGRSLRLEGIEIKLNGYENLGVKYVTHIQNIGWEDQVGIGWKENGKMSGTEGKSYRLEGIKIELTGSNASKYDIYYRVHAENIGWMGWAKNGELAGSAGCSYRLEGIQIEIIEKGSKVFTNEGKYPSSFYQNMISYGISLNNNTGEFEENYNYLTIIREENAGNSCINNDPNKSIMGYYLKFKDENEILSETTDLVYAGFFPFKFIPAMSDKETWFYREGIVQEHGGSPYIGPDKPHVFMSNIKADFINKGYNGNIDDYDIYYKCSYVDSGWQEWLKNGEMYPEEKTVNGVVNGVKFLLLSKGARVADENVDLVKEVTPEPVPDPRAGWFSINIEGFGGYLISPGRAMTRPNIDPSKIGYTFDGYFEDPEFTKNFDFSQIITKNTIIYPKFTKIE